MLKKNNENKMLKGWLIKLMPIKIGLYIKIPFIRLFLWGHNHINLCLSAVVILYVYQLVSYQYKAPWTLFVVKFHYEILTCGILNTAIHGIQLHKHPTGLGLPCYLTHWPHGSLNEILHIYFSNIFRWLMVEASLVKLPWYYSQWTSPMISQHWFR